MKTSSCFSSNAERLNLKEWVAVLVILLFVAYFWPIIGSALEDFDPQSDYRMPYLLSEDYWMFQRCAQEASERFPAVIIGDSFVWGQYVGAAETISREINQLANEELLFNLGVNGLHPAAMRGILRYYGEDIQHKGVILHLNLLWMSSEQRDLQGEEEFRFNHPRLIPQFNPPLRCYRASFSEKMSVLIERNTDFFSWVRHAKLLYFENLDIPNWTLLNPYSNPLRAVTFSLPPVDSFPQSRPLPWTQQKMEPESFSWVQLENSFQWSSFQLAVKELQARGNSVLVLIGPFNPYLQTEESLLRYRTLQRKAEEWLSRKDLHYHSPSDLPSELFADASHPLGEGYVRIAEELFRARAFRQWLSELKEKAGKLSRPSIPESTPRVE